MRERGTQPRGERPARKKGVRLNYRKLMEEHDRCTSESSRVWRAPNGTSKIRILMLPNEGLWHVSNREIYVPTAEGKKKFFISPRTADPEAYCPAEEAFELLKKAKKPDLAQQIRPSYSFFSNAVVNEGKEWKYRIYKYPQTVYKALVLAESDEIDEEELDDAGFLQGGGIIGDPQKGRTFTVKRTETANRVEYQIHVTGKVLPAEQEWLDKCSDLEEFTTPSDPEDIKEAILDWLDIEDLSEIVDGPSSEEEEDDEEDTPWEDELGEEEDDEEEEPESPSRSRKAKAERPSHASRTGKPRTRRQRRG